MINHPQILEKLKSVLNDLIYMDYFDQELVNFLAEKVTELERNIKELENTKNQVAIGTSNSEITVGQVEFYVGSTYEIPVFVGPKFEKVVKPKRKYTKKVKTDA